ncbi:MAG: hypothetical protein QNJ89_10305 [Acidimicrobiia bacterium]|nr:hypothetical protein [Acidimicrobiia bacterium]
MLQIRRAHEIHEREGGWFNARWHFSTRIEIRRTTVLVRCGSSTTIDWSPEPYGRCILTVI